MPVWSYKEIQAACQLIFSCRPEAEVTDRFIKWGGIPRFVLQLTDAADQDFLRKGVSACSIRDLEAGMSSISSASPQIAHMLLHVTVTAGYLKGPVVFASEWVEEQLARNLIQSKCREVEDFFASSGGVSGIAAFREMLWKCYAHAKLQRGGLFWRREPDWQLQRYPIELAQCTSYIELRDDQDVASLRSREYSRGMGWASIAVDAVEQPDKLFIFSMSVANAIKIDVKGLSMALQAMHAKRKVVVYLGVPPGVFQCIHTSKLEAG